MALFEYGADVSSITLLCVTGGFTHPLSRYLHDEIGQSIGHSSLKNENSDGNISICYVDGSKLSIGGF